MSNLTSNPDRPGVLIIGGGVHAVVVADCIRAGGQAWNAGYCDAPGHDRSNMQRMGVACLGDDAEALSRVPALGICAAILGMAGIQHGALRKALVRRCGRVPAWWTAIHPCAVVAESAVIGAGSLVLAGAVINPLARIGEHAVINTAAVIEHHALVGDFAVVSPHATVCGGAAVAEGAFVGAGATILTGVTIGRNAIVGAGALVLRDVAEGTTVVGNPARAIRNPSSERLSRAHANLGDRTIAGVAP
jgi:sugar O-acyltransferase (sialic acid O-acetyltransferase NeuD family)